MKIRNTQHSTQNWRISEITHDFELIDAWALPVHARPSEFSALETIIRELNPNAKGAPRLPAMLFAFRRQLGRLFGWDDSANALAIPGCIEASLRDRLPPDLRDASAEPDDRERFQLVFRTETEWARERSNDTVHAVLHIGWVPQQDGLFQAQLGVYVKTRGPFGAIYMAMIRPFRHFIIYPTMLREIGKAWETRPRVPSRSPMPMCANRKL